MTRLPARVREWLRSPAGVHECRNCATTLDDDRTTCPVCGPIDTTRYVPE